MLNLAMSRIQCPISTIVLTFLKPFNGRFTCEYPIRYTYLCLILLLKYQNFFLKIIVCFYYKTWDDGAFLFSGFVLRMLATSRSCASESGRRRPENYRCKPDASSKSPETRSVVQFGLSEFASMKYQTICNF